MKQLLTNILIIISATIAMSANDVYSAKLSNLKEDLESVTKCLSSDFEPTIISYHENSNMLLIGNSESLKLCRSKNGIKTSSMEVSDDIYIDQSVASFSPLGNLLTINLVDRGYGGLWHLPSGNRIPIGNTNGYVGTSTFTPDGSIYLQTVLEETDLGRKAYICSYLTHLGTLEFYQDRYIPWRIEIDPDLDKMSNAFIATTNKHDIIVYATGHTINIYNKNKLVKELQTPKDEIINNISLSWKGDTLVVAHEGRCSTWDIRTDIITSNPKSTIKFNDFYTGSGRSIRSMPLFNKDNIPAFFLSPDGNYLISYHIKTRQLTMLKKTKSSWEIANIDNEGKIVAAGFTPTRAIILLSEKKNKEENISYKISYIPPDNLGEILLTGWIEPTKINGTNDEKIEIKPRPVTQAPNPGEILTPIVSVSERGNVLVIGGTTGSVEALDTSTGRRIASFPLRFSISKMSISPDGLWVLFKGLDGDFAKYDILNGRLEREPLFHYNRVGDFSTKAKVSARLGTTELAFEPIYPWQENAIDEKLDDINPEDCAFSENGKRLAVLSSIDTGGVNLVQFSYPNLERIGSPIPITNPSNVSGMVLLNDGFVVLATTTEGNTGYSLFSEDRWLSDGTWPKEIANSFFSEVGPNILADNYGKNLIEIQANKVNIINTKIGLSKKSDRIEQRVAYRKDGSIIVLNHELMNVYPFNEGDRLWKFVTSERPSPYILDDKGQEYAVYMKSNGKLLDANTKPDIDGDIIFIETGKGKIKEFSISNIFNKGNAEHDVSVKHKYELQVLKPNNNIKNWEVDKIINIDTDNNDTGGRSFELKAVVSHGERLWVFMDKESFFIDLDDTSNKYSFKTFPSTQVAKHIESFCVTGDESALVVGSGNWVGSFDLSALGNHKYVKFPGSVKKIVSYNANETLIEVSINFDQEAKELLKNGGAGFKSEVFRLDTRNMQYVKHQEKVVVSSLSADGKAIIDYQKDGVRVLDLEGEHVYATIPRTNLPLYDPSFLEISMSEDKRWILIFNNNPSLINGKSSLSDRVLIWNVTTNKSLDWPAIIDEVFTDNNTYYTYEKSGFFGNDKIIFEDNGNSLVLDLPSLAVNDVYLNSVIMSNKNIKLVSSVNEGGARIITDKMDSYIPPREYRKIHFPGHIEPIFKSKFLIIRDGNQIKIISIEKGEIVGNIIFTESSSKSSSPYYMIMGQYGHFQSNDMDEIRGLSWAYPEDENTIKGLSPFSFMNTHYCTNILSKILENQLEDVIIPSNLTLSQPIVEITKISYSDDAKNLLVDINISPPIEDKYGVEVKEVKLFQDGILVGSLPRKINTYTDMLKLNEGLEADSLISYGHHSIPIKNPLRDVEFYAYSYNQSGIRSEDSTVFKYSPLNKDEGEGRIVLLSIGIGDNTINKFRLKAPPFAAKNMKQILGNLIGVNPDQYLMVRETVNNIDSSIVADPTKVNIAAVFAALAGVDLKHDDSFTKSIANQGIPNKIKPIGVNDVLIINIHGHGISAKEAFLIIPQDLPIGASVDDFLKTNSITEKHSISDRELYEWLKPINCRQLFLIIDTCAAGAILTTGESISAPLGNHNLDRISYDKSMPILFAAQKNENAQSTDFNKNTVLVKRLQKLSSVSPQNKIKDNPVLSVYNLLKNDSLREVGDDATDQNIGLILHNRARIINKSHAKNGAN